MRRASFVTGVLLVCAAWLACLGDDPMRTSGAAPGERLGACLSDHRCNAGLECRVPEQICLAVGEPVPADGGGDGTAKTDGAMDGEASDAPADRSGFDGAACVGTSAAFPGPPACPSDPCPTDQGCCVTQSSATCMSRVGCGQANRFLTCDNGGCGGAFSCCLDPGGTTVTTDGARCLKKIGGLRTTCVGGTSCPSAVKLCKDAADCETPTPRCELIEVDMSVAFRPILKLCVP